MLRIRHTVVKARLRTAKVAPDLDELDLTWKRCSR
jgi:hypothetical protein